jgi:formyltetrahydrofolate hydrolase
LELDPNTIDSAKEGAPIVSRDVSADREEVVVEKLLEISKDIARAALCKALTFYLSAYINLIFG